MEQLCEDVICHGQKSILYHLSSLYGVTSFLSPHSDVPFEKVNAEDITSFIYPLDRENVYLQDILEYISRFQDNITIILWSCRGGVTNTNFIYGTSLFEYMGRIYPIFPYEGQTYLHQCIIRTTYFQIRVTEMKKHEFAILLFNTVESSFDINKEYDLRYILLHILNTIFSVSLSSSIYIIYHIAHFKGNRLFNILLNMGFILHSFTGEMMYWIPKKEIFETNCYSPYKIC